MTDTTLAPVASAGILGWRRYLPTGERPPIGDTELAVLIVCNLVTTVGLAGDIARHLQHPEQLTNDFLSGWHLVLYGGVAAVGAWIGVGAIRHGPSFVGSVATTTLGFSMLAVGGGLDAAWHEVFGTEAAIEALVSPPHLLVFAGLMFLLTSPIVVLWARPDCRLGLVPSLAVMVSVISALLVTSLFTGFLSPMAGGLALQVAYVEPLLGESLQVYDQVRGLGIAVWTVAVLVAAFSIVLTRFRLVPGLCLVGMLALGIPVVILSGTSIIPLVIGFGVAGQAVELCVILLGRPVLGRGAAVVTGAVFGSSLWAGTFAALKIDGRLLWGPSLWAGTITISALVGAAVAGLVTLRIPAGVRPEAVPGGPVADPERARSALRG